MVMIIVWMIIKMKRTIRMMMFIMMRMMRVRNVNGKCKDDGVNDENDDKEDDRLCG